MTITGMPASAAAFTDFASAVASGIETTSPWTFCETAASALRALRANVERLGYGDRAVVRRQDARRRLAADARAGTGYELIMLDPPYRMLTALQEDFSLHLPHLLVPGGIAVIESPTSHQPLELPLRMDTTRVQGGSRLTVYLHD